MRDFSKNVSLVEVRLHCLDMAVNSARLLGRADGVEAVADGYYAWVTKKPPQPDQPQQASDDAGAVGGETQQPQQQQPATDTGNQKLPPSLSGASGNKTKD